MADAAPATPVALAHERGRRGAAPEAQQLQPARDLAQLAPLLRREAGGPALRAPQELDEPRAVTRVELVPVRLAGAEDLEDAGATGSRGGRTGDGRASAGPLPGTVRGHAATQLDSTNAIVHIRYDPGRAPSRSPRRRRPHPGRGRPAHGHLPARRRPARANRCRTRGYATLDRALRATGHRLEARARRARRRASTSRRSRERLRAHAGGAPRRLPGVAPRRSRALAGAARRVRALSSTPSASCARSSRARRRLRRHRRHRRGAPRVGPQHVRPRHLLRHRRRQPRTRSGRSSSQLGARLRGVDDDVPFAPDAADAAAHRGAHARRRSPETSTCSPARRRARPTRRCAGGPIASSSAASPCSSPRSRT